MPDHPPSRWAVSAERAFLRHLGGGCHTPVGALGRVGEDGSLHVRGLVAAPDGRHVVRDEITGPPDRAEALGRDLAEKLLAAGAREIVRKPGAGGTDWPASEARA